jgi:DNA-binding NtrC family response regulator
MKDRSKIRILVVDDEPSICDSLMDYLEDLGFEVLAACGAHEALEILAKEPRDVAIIDIRLPGMNGDHLVIEAHRLQPDLRFLIHTGSSNYHPSDELVQRGIRPEHIFTKPVRNLSLLKEAIEKLVQEEENHHDQ